MHESESVKVSPTPAVGARGCRRLAGVRETFTRTAPSRRNTVDAAKLLYDFGCLNEQRRGDSPVQRFSGFEIDNEFEAA